MSGQAPLDFHVVSEQDATGPRQPIRRVAMAMVRKGVGMSNLVFPQFVGCGRSGTTLLRNMFDSHSALAMTHESHFIGPLAKVRSRYESEAGFDCDVFVADLFSDAKFVRQGLELEAVRSALEKARPETYAAAVRAVFAAYAAREGKTLYGDKTPGSVTQIELLAELFPEAKFVHIIRDGRAVALSFLERPEWGPKTMAEAASYWKNRLRRGRAAGWVIGPERYMEIRYEDLVTDPEAAARQVCGFLGLDFEDGMLRYHEKSKEFIASTKDPAAFKNLSRPVTAGLRTWEDEISSGDQRLFEAIAGDLLKELGYPVSGASPDIATRIRAIIAATLYQWKRIVAFLSARLKRSIRLVEDIKEEVG